MIGTMVFNLFPATLSPSRLVISVSWRRGNMILDTRIPHSIGLFRDSSFKAANWKAMGGIRSHLSAIVSMVNAMF